MLSNWRKQPADLEPLDGWNPSVLGFDSLPLKLFHLGIGGLKQPQSNTVI